MLKNKVILAIFITLFVFLSLVLITKNIGQSPYEFLENYFNHNSSNSERVDEILFYYDLGNNEFVIFYINKNGTASCAIIRRTFLSYRVLLISSEVSLEKEKETETIGFLFHSYNNSKDWIYWGIIHDKDKSVRIDDIEAKMVSFDRHSFRIAFLAGHRKDLQYLPSLELN